MTSPRNEYDLDGNTAREDKMTTRLSDEVQRDHSTPQGVTLKSLSKMSSTSLNGTAKHSAITIDDGDELKSTRKDTVAPITVKFEDIKYKVVVQAPSSMNPLKGLNPMKYFQKPPEGSEKEILHGISGSVLPGEVLAMLGPSGGGKTSFLNVMGGRMVGKVTGSITYNDLPYNKALKRKLGFVTQDDTFFPHLTVRETLMYAALLRLPRNLTRDEKIRRADDIIGDLGLQRCKDTIIGGMFLRGISGGERKRVSIGHEILIDPSLLLLDEPTSGLDSTTALRIIQLLHKIAQSGRTVVTTIHQPSSRLFHNFDKLLLLSEGHSIYFGKAQGAMDYFASIGLEPMLTVNPADFMLDLANGTISDISVPRQLEEEVASWHSKPPLEQQAGVKSYLVDTFRQLLLPEVVREVRELPIISEGSRNVLLERRTWNASWFQQFSVLWTRGIKERRHDFLSPLRIFQIASVALIVGCLWFDSKNDTAQHVQDQVGLLFFMALFWGFIPLVTSIFTFPQERAVLAKERASDMYQLSAYFMSRTLADIPMEYCLPIAFLVIVYFMTSLKAAADAFFLCLLSIFLDIAVAQSLGFLLGAAIMDVKKATTMASVILLAFMLSGGYYIQKVPAFIRWIKYISFNYYSYRLIILTQYSPSQTYNCGPPGNLESQKCLIQDVDALDQNNLSDSGWTDAWPLLLMVIIYRFLAYYALRRLKVGP